MSRTRLTNKVLTVLLAIFVLAVIAVEAVRLEALPVAALCVSYIALLGTDRSRPPAHTNVDLGTFI